jgi:DNA-binding transcriptional LysR family regulator
MSIMMDWDDLKIFLAIARAGSVRGAANELKVNQSTVSRRIAAFEKTIGATLFEKLPSGYEITAVGENILANAEQIEEQVFSIDRCLFQQKAENRSVLKVALPVPLATNMLMPDITRFTNEHPEIRLDIAVSSDTLNLSKRETDVAIRIIKIGETPPPYLIGRKLVTYAESIYVAKNRMNKKNGWIGHSETDIQPSKLQSDLFPKSAIEHSVDSLMTKLSAVKAGMGMATLPCCFADIEEELMKVPTAPLLPGREIWLLTHVDLKNTPRVRLFLNFILEVFEKNKDLLEGRFAKS